MASNVVFNGVTYSVPAVGDDNWGPDLSAYFISIASNALQKSGGSFTLTADVDFGATYGLKSAYYTSKGTNPASSGAVRLANLEGVYWRNAANGGNLGLTVSASDILTYNGNAVLDAGSAALTGLITNAMVSNSAAIAYSKLNLATSIVNADISASAAIAYSKLALTGAILNADLAGSIAYSKLSLTGAILNADLAGSIAYSKLSLTGSIVDADIGAAAAIAVSKLAAVTASRALVSDASGFISAATTTSTEIGYVNGVTSAIQTQLDAKTSKSTLTTKGDIYAATAASTPARVAVGTDGQVLTADSASSPGVKWATPSAAPSQSYEITNLGLATSVGSSALTIAVKQADGSSDPSSGASAVKVGMRSSTLTSGAYNQRSITSALSLVISSGSTLGHANGVAHNIYVYLIDNAGTLELAASQSLYNENQVVSTTAEGGAGAADSNSAIYSTTARSNVPIRVIGVLTSTQTTAGTWAAVPTTTHVGDFGIISATNTVAIKYYDAAGTTINSSNNTKPFNTKVYDDKNAFVGSTGIFTAPEPGRYAFAVKHVSSSTLAASDQWTLTAVKNSSTIVAADVKAGTGAANTYNSVQVSGDVDLLAGDTLQFNSFTGSATLSLISTAGYNTVSIHKIK